MCGPLPQASECVFPKLWRGSHRSANNGITFCAVFTNQQAFTSFRVLWFFRTARFSPSATAATDSWDTVPQLRSGDPDWFKALAEALPRSAAAGKRLEVVNTSWRERLAANNVELVQVDHLNQQQFSHFL